VLLRAKKLGERSRKIRIIRIVLLVMVCTAIPIGLTCNIVSASGDFPEVIATVGIAIGGLSIAVSLLSTTFFLIIVHRWVKKLSKENTSSRRIRKVSEKNKWLIGVNVSLIFVLLIIGVFANVPKELPYMFLCASSFYSSIDSLLSLPGFSHSLESPTLCSDVDNIFCLVVAAVDRVVEIMATVCLFGFLQSYLTRRGFFYGYFTILFGDKETIEKMKSTSSNSTQRRTNEAKTASTLNPNTNTTASASISTSVSVSTEEVDTNS